MTIKVVTLNTWLLKFYDSIVEFLHQENPDFILLQEVTSGREIDIDHGISNGYEKLREDLKDYYSIFHPMRRYEPKNGVYWFGHTIFSKHEFLHSFSHFYLDHKIDVVTGDSFRNVMFPGLVIGVEALLGHQHIFVMTTHFLWSMHPEITPRQLQGVDNLVNYLNGFGNLIIGGDFNVTDESEVYQRLVSSLVDDRPPGNKRTLHPQIHPTGESKDLAVDFIFHKGERIRLLNSHVPLLPLSDHLPVVAEYQINME